MLERMEALVRQRQKDIVGALEKEDGKKFFVDEWQRDDGRGGGVTCVIQRGNVIEKAGVNISILEGEIPPEGIKKMRANHESLQTVGGKSLPFKVVGLSMIVHPQNPMAPTTHMNYRYFETQNDDGSPLAWWFGGGADLTPHYLFEEDCEFFHNIHKKACDKHDPEYYPKFKKWCDEYFRNTHRNEGRGIGGIFFDDLSDKSAEETFKLVEDGFQAFIDSYIPILHKRKDMEYTEEQKNWQLIRRGRYVEFNLVHDRGTAFGLHTPGARIESIMCSMPLYASWEYQHAPEKGTEEDKMLQVLQTPREWATC